MLLQAQAQGGGYGMLIMMVAIFAIMYFFMIRPQNKKQKEIANFRFRTLLRRMIRLFLVAVFTAQCVV